MKTILCPTDFSACTDNAIHYANHLANHARAKLILFHSVFVADAMPYAGMSFHPEVSTGELAQLQDQLIHIKQNLKTQTPEAAFDYEIKIGNGPVEDEIGHISNTKQVDLIVMGTTGAYSLKQLLLGSTAAHVIEKTSCPVLVIPQKVAFKPIETIVFAADLSKEHPCDLTEVISLAKTFDARIIILHVLQKKGFVSDSLAHIQYSDIYSLIKSNKISFHTIEDTDIERGILLFSQRIKADLIVMINHKRDLLESLLKNSYTKKMAYHTPFPLLVIHN
jgi:nucleotide-binding universal stress UspA family protein